MASLKELRTERIKKLEALKQLGINPYPIESNQGQTIAVAIGEFNSLAQAGKVLNLVGRIRAIRSQGALIFFNFDDDTATLQALLKKDGMVGEDFECFQNLVDIGDFVQVSGTLFLTKKNEKTIQVKSWKMLVKSLRPLPDQWGGLQDIEERFRRRYLDSLMSPEIKARFIFRSKLITAIRTFLNKAGFLEVETPILQPQAGGATAKPFKTHHDALNLDIFLRISEELYLKRMMIGGFPRIYSVSHNFRNEGVDTTHNPEFTMLEFYEAYSTAKAERSFIEKMIKTLVKQLTGGTAIHFNGQAIDFNGKFKMVTYFDLLKRYALITDPQKIKREDLLLKASQLAAKVEKTDSQEKLFDAIYKKVCRPKLIQPTFIIGYPKDYLPLAKRQEDNPGLVDAFQLIVGGMEIVKAFSELNDPIDQAERFAIQDEQGTSGDDEAQKTDQDFIEALEYGMPPAGGVGIGIDRLTMLLTDTHNIREVIYFPTMRPR